MYDLLICDGKIVDGSGQPGFVGNIAVLDGRIVAVGDVQGEARKVIGARGLVVAWPSICECVSTHPGATTNPLSLIHI